MRSPRLHKLLPELTCENERFKSAQHAEPRGRHQCDRRTNGDFLVQDRHERTLAMAKMARLAAFSGLMFIMRFTTSPFSSLDCAQQK